MNPICNRKNYFQFYRTFAKLTSIRSRLLSTDVKSKQIASKLLLEAKQKSNLTFDEIAKKLNVNKVLFDHLSINFLNIVFRRFG